MRHPFLDLRGAWNRNVMDLTGTDLDRLAGILADAGVGVAAIGSPIGKSTIDHRRRSRWTG